MLLEKLGILFLPDKWPKAPQSSDSLSVSQSDQDILGVGVILEPLSKVSCPAVEGVWKEGGVGGGHWHYLMTISGAWEECRSFLLSAHNSVSGKDLGLGSFLY